MAYQSSLKQKLTANSVPSISNQPQFAVDFSLRGALQQKLYCQKI